MRGGGVGWAKHYAGVLSIAGYLLRRRRSADTRWHEGFYLGYEGRIGCCHLDDFDWHWGWIYLDTVDLNIVYKLENSYLCPGRAQPILGYHDLIRGDAGFLETPITSSPFSKRNESRGFLCL